MLFVEKHKPSKSTDILGAQYTVMGITSWLRSWNTPQRQFKAALLSGPPGIGKTLLANLVCVECGFKNIVKLDSSRKRTKKALEEVVEAFMSRKIDAYLTGKMQNAKASVVIIDDLDTMVTGSSDRGGVSQIVKFIKTKI